MDDEARRCGAVVIAIEEPMVARILEHKLRREGHAVRRAGDAASLHATMSAEPADVVLVSTALVDHALLRDDVRRPRAGWLVVLSSFDAPGAAHEAMSSGAAGIVRMPFKPTAVAAQVATLLSLVPA